MIGCAYVAGSPCRARRSRRSRRSICTALTASWDARLAESQGGHIQAFPILSRWSLWWTFTTKNFHNCGHITVGMELLDALVLIPSEGTSSTVNGSGPFFFLPVERSTGRPVDRSTGPSSGPSSGPATTLCAYVACVTKLTLPGS